MKWFKHDSDANLDDKLQHLMLDYGLEGYGLYWYCLELIANKFEINNINFNLKHDARIIAKNTGSSEEKVGKMMSRMVELGLFTQSQGIISCLKLGHRFEMSSTSNPKMRGVIAKLKAKYAEKNEAVMIEKKEKKEKKSLGSNETLFVEFWKIYPHRNGKSVTKPQSLQWWLEQTDDTITMVLKGARNYRKYIEQCHKDNKFNGGIPDPIRFLKNKRYEDYQTQNDAKNRMVIENKLAKQDSNFYNLTKEEQNERINSYSE